MPNGAGILSWLHIGDPPITQVGEQNHRDLLRIVEHIRALDAGSIDFALLPGDNAGGAASDTLTFVANRHGSFERPPKIGEGSDRDGIGAWPGRHLLGPNRNRRKW